MRQSSLASLAAGGLAHAMIVGRMPYFDLDRRRRVSFRSSSREVLSTQSRRDLL